MKSPLSQFAGQYQEWLTVAPLRDHLSRVWVNDLTVSAAKDYYVVPDGCVDILWTGESLYVAGPDTHPILEQAPPGCRLVGVRFRPGAAYPWLGAPLSEILNARVPLEEFWKRDRLVALTPRPDLADLATEAGFADQAHMSREVRRLCSATPAELVAQLSV